MKSLRKELRDLFPKDMRKFNSWGKREKSKMTESLNLLISPQMKRGIRILIEHGKFRDRSEFIRYLIVKYFDEMTFYED